MNNITLIANQNDPYSFKMYWLDDNNDVANTL